MYIEMIRLSIIDFLKGEGIDCVEPNNSNTLELINCVTLSDSTDESLMNMLEFDVCNVIKCNGINNIVDVRFEPTIKIDEFCSSYKLVLEYNK